MLRLSSLLLFLGLATPASSLAAQARLPDGYLHQLPPRPRIVGQTPANVRFHLWGDPGAADYRDVHPRDGVDDRRAERLLLLAERFSPILRRNTFLVPREVEAFLGDRVRLHVDSWLEGERVASTTLDLGPPLHGESVAGRKGEASYVSAVASDDAGLSSLLPRLLPSHPRPQVIPPAGEAETVLYLDFPGDHEDSWRRAYRAIPPAGSRIYVHPFIHEAEREAGETRYEFLLQYWFFYPYNDGANNHEGDWEHITVSITTTRRAREHAAQPHRRGRLHQQDLRALLDSVAPLPLDSLLIRSVAYYFHNNVMVLDYLAAAAGEPLWPEEPRSDGALHIWEDTGFVRAAIRRRVALLDGRLATHPIGYIGGNNKGLDELLQPRPRFLDSYNRDSHGTYPFPGVWRKVGPLDATEKIYGDVVPAVHRDDSARAWYQLIADERYLVYRARDLVLLPDWERLAPLVLEDAAARRRWFWFVLPVHLGFPASPSPGAGALHRVDLGNVAPLGPAYNTAWNRPATTSVYREYQPTVLRVALAPISPLASLQSGWGVLNYPLVLWGLMPGGNVAVTQLLPWVTGAMHVLGAPPARTFFRGELPTRFTSIGAGVYRQLGGREFARLLPGEAEPEVQSLLQSNRGRGARVGPRARTNEVGRRLWFNLYYGSRVSIENTFSIGSAELSYPILAPGGHEVGAVTGSLETRELTGGLTYRLPPLSSPVWRLYVRTGYAWTAYSLHDVTLAPAAVRLDDRQGGYMLSLLPSRRWWPNTVYAGFGVEAFSPPSAWLLRRLGYGARLEVSGLLHRLAAEDDCRGCRVGTERGDVALLLHFGW